MHVTEIYYGYLQHLFSVVYQNCDKTKCEIKHARHNRKSDSRIQVDNTVYVSVALIDLEK